MVCAMCELEGERLELLEILLLTSFTAFETLLNTPGEWFCGIDAPFSQPRKLTEDLALPPLWPAYVSAFAAMGREGFVTCLNAYREKQPSGKKEHLRLVDTVAKAISPMKLYGVPVGKMFFELAPRLVKTALNIPLLRPTADKRTVIEVYPSLIARALLGKRGHKKQGYRKQGYKSDTKKQQTKERAETRENLIKALESQKLQATYGIKVSLTAKQKEMLMNDAKGDTLDAFLAAIQTAWAYRQTNFGFPTNVDGLEGWIADPSVTLVGLKKA
jgi:Protein of unknown function (DUF429)